MNLQIIDIIYYGSCYLSIGTLVALAIDRVLRKTEIDTPFTIFEAITTVLLWPLVIVLAIINAIKHSNDV